MESRQTLQERLLALKPKAIDAFSQLVIDGARHALADNLNPLRFNFFSTAVRILFEHMMGKLAPIDQVKQSAWFVAKKEDGNHPTKEQRIAFAIQGGLADSFVEDQLNVAVHPLRKKLINTVNDLSKYVHGREETIISGVEEQDSEAHKVIDAIHIFLATYHECRSAIIDPIQEQLDDAAIDALLSETIQEIDELASHHCVDEVYVDSVLIDIGPTHIIYRVTGTVSVTLQWGSNSDRQRGDGAEIEQSFPFQCNIEVPLNDPWDLSLGETDYGVDTSKWRDAMQPDEWG
jgi:hypothetical protein